MEARTWPEREAALLAAYEQVAALHNALQVTPPVATGVEQMWDRPFKVLWGDFPGAQHAQIQDPAVLRIAETWPAGGVDRLRDLVWRPQTRGLLRGLIEGVD